MRPRHHPPPLTQSLGFPTSVARVLLGIALGGHNSFAHSDVWFQRNIPPVTAPSCLLAPEQKQAGHELESRIGLVLLLAFGCELGFTPSSGKVEASLPLKTVREGQPMSFLCRGISVFLGSMTGSGSPDISAKSLAAL